MDARARHAECGTISGGRSAALRFHARPSHAATLRRSDRADLQHPRREICTASGDVITAKQRFRLAMSASGRAFPICCSKCAVTCVGWNRSRVPMPGLTARRKSCCRSGWIAWPRIMVSLPTPPRAARCAPGARRKRGVSALPDELHEIFVHTVENQFAFLVVNGGTHRDHTGRALGRKLPDFQRGIERVAGIDRFEEFSADLDETDQALANDMRKKSGAGCGEAQDLKTMRQGRLMAEPLAIFGVVMDRVIVEADGLERRKVRIADGARRVAEDFADTQLLKASQFDDPVILRLKIGHGGPPRRLGGGHSILSIRSGHPPPAAGVSAPRSPPSPDQGSAARCCGIVRWRPTPQRRPFRGPGRLAPARKPQKTVWRAGSPRYSTLAVPNRDWVHAALALPPPLSRRLPARSSRPSCALTRETLSGALCRVLKPIGKLQSNSVNSGSSANEE